MREEGLEGGGMRRSSEEGRGRRDEREDGGWFGRVWRNERK